MKTHIRPQNIADWIVIFGLILSTIVYTSRRILIFSNPDYRFLPVLDRLIIIDNFEMFGFGIGMCALIISGFQKLRMPALKRNGIVYLIAGSSIGIFLIGLNLFVSSSLPYLAQKILLSDEQRVQIERRLNTENIRPDMKDRLKEIVAEQKYLKTGVITNYVNAAGETVEYEPSSETIEIKRNIDKIMGASSKAHAWSIIWGALLIFSLLIGFVAARYMVTNKKN